MESSYEEHEKILQMIRKQQYADVEQLVRTHKFKAIESWLNAALQ